MLGHVRVNAQRHQGVEHIFNYSLLSGIIEKVNL
jgi:hypothetical protein